MGVRRGNLNKGREEEERDVVRKEKNGDEKRKQQK